MNLARLELYIPKWVEMLPPEHPVKEGLVNAAKELMQNGERTEGEDGDNLDVIRKLEFVSKTTRENTQEEGTEKIRVDVDDAWYYRMLSELAGVRIEGEYQLISMIKELSRLKSEYMKAKDAMEDVRNTGYGVITPGLDEIQMEEPIVTRQGNKFGVKLKAVSPSVHLIRAVVETEISTNVGNEQQAEDLISFIKNAEQSQEGIWETNIFGKTIREMTEDGIQEKVAKITDESRQKLQDVMQRIVNENKGGFICIII
ncbi:MAG: hypothetical protein Q4F83_03180 [Eubacteriales bacterium]|nr:hypothetical protein [Eubacteriales bacterium]